MKNLLIVVFLFTINVYGKTLKVHDYDSLKVHIPGTKLYINKPNDFEYSNKFSGFENGKNTIAFDAPKLGNYISFTKNLTLESLLSLKERKGEIIEFYNTKIDKFPATFILEERTGFQNLQVIFGNENILIFIIARIYDTDKIKISDLKRAMLSIEYKETQSRFPYHTSTFTINDSDNTFKFSQEILNIYDFTISGEERRLFQETTESYTINQIELETDSVTPKFIFESSFNSFDYTAFENQEKIMINQNIINNAYSYQEVLVGILNGIKSKVRITAIVNKRNALVIQEISRYDDHNTQYEYDKLTKSIVLK